MENEIIEKDDIIIISEENKNLDYEFRKNKKWCWLVDPIDGTKEFVKKNGEFTVNIGLVEDGIPVSRWEIIEAAKKIAVLAKEGKLDPNNVDETEFDVIAELKINAYKNLDDKNVRIVASSSHLNKETQTFIDKFDEPIIISTGSSIKLLFMNINRYLS